MDAAEIIRQNIAKDREKLDRLYARLPCYAEELATELLGVGNHEASDEELELSYHELKEKLSGVSDTATALDTATIPSPLRDAENAILAAETVKALAEKATVYSFLPALDAQEGKCAYFRNAYSDEAFRIFKRYLTRPTVSYTDSPADACRDVFNELASFAILPIESSKDGILSGIARQVARYELSPVLYCMVSQPGSEEAMRFGLYAASPVLIEDADGLSAILFTQNSDSLFPLILAADALGCALAFSRETGEAQGFANTYELTFRRKEGALPNAVFLLSLLLRCEYPHHQLSGLYRTLHSQ
ncbi:MAG: hypothetical protein IJW46_06765 [Clostridia bacterium]|nr:hypothetical protein [Clostridia bacterium]